VLTCGPMKFDRVPLVTSLTTFLLAFALTLGSAEAAGSISYSRKEIHESNGGWHLMMTLVYGGKPATAHVPMRFTFTPISIYENYLDDPHGEKPQKRKIALIGQVPINESVDVDFADSRGKLFDRTRFDFTITRAHGFSAGDYTVAVHRSVGAQIGATQTLSLLGDNPVIDRRTMSFVGNIKKDKPAAQGAASDPAADPAAAAEPAAAPAAAGQAAEGSGETLPGDPPADPAAAEKVPPSSRGCGCRLAPNASGFASWLPAVGALALWRLRRRRLPL